jgi:hypothetical protein
MNESNLIHREGKDIPTLLNCVYPSVILNIDDSDSENESHDDESCFFQFMLSRYENGTQQNDHKFCDIDNNEMFDDRSITMNIESDYDSNSILDSDDNVE